MANPFLSIKPILPARPVFPSGSQVVAAIDQGMGDAMTDVVSGPIQDIVGTWTNPPKTTVLVYQFKREFRIEDDRFNWANKGTRPRLIQVRRARALRFYGDWKAKTRPGQLKSGAGNRGSRPVFRRWVRHPGIRARNWDPLIKEAADRFVRQRMDEQMRRIFP